jgi:hypothetical protein
VQNITGSRDRTLAGYIYIRLITRHTDDGGSGTLSSKNKNIKPGKLRGCREAGGKWQTKGNVERRDE